MNLEEILLDRDTLKTQETAELPPKPQGSTLSTIATSQKRVRMEPKTPPTPSRAPTTPKRPKQQNPVTKDKAESPKRISKIPIRLKSDFVLSRPKKKVDASGSKLPVPKSKIPRSFAAFRTRATQTHLPYGASFTLTTVEQQTVSLPKPDTDPTAPYQYPMVSYKLHIQVVRYCITS